MIQYGYICNRSNIVKKSKMYSMMFVPCIVTIAMCPCFMVLLCDCVFERGRESVYIPAKSWIDRSTSTQMDVTSLFVGVHRLTYVSIRVSIE